MKTTYITFLSLLLTTHYSFAQDSSKFYYDKAITAKSEVSLEEYQSNAALMASGSPMEEHMKNKFDEAILYYTKAIQFNPACYECFKERGDTKFTIEDYDGVFEDLFSAFKIAQNDIDKQLECLQVIKGYPIRKISFVISQLDSLIKQNPQIKYYEVRADNESEIGDYENALKDYELIFQKGKYLDKDILWSIAFCQSRLGNNIEAVKNYTEVIDKKEKNIKGLKYSELGKLYMSRGNCKMELKDFRGALMDFEKAFAFRQKWNEVFPLLAEIYNATGRAKIELNDNAGAIIDLNKALNSYTGSTLSVGDSGKPEIDPDKAETYYLRGLAKHNLKNKDGACKDWSKAGQYGATNAYELIEQNCN